MLNCSEYTPICEVLLIWDSQKWQNLTHLVTNHHVGGAKKLIKPECWCDDFSSCQFAAFCFLNFSLWFHFFLERLSVVMPPSSRTLPVILIEPWLALIKTIILYLSPRYRSWIRDTTADLFQNCNLTRITIHSERRSLYEKCGLQPS